MPMPKPDTEQGVSMRLQRCSDLVNLLTDKESFQIDSFHKFHNDALIVYNSDSIVRNACVPEYVLDLMVYTRCFLFICKEGKNVSLCKCDISFRLYCQVEKMFICNLPHSLV